MGQEMSNVRTGQEDARKALVSRIEALSQAIEKAKNLRWNMSGSTMDAAIDRLLEGKPAYWNDTSYNFATACNLTGVGNFSGTIVSEAASMVASHGQKNAELALDAQIPLNAAAVEELGRAYLAIGSFRTRSELAEREGAYLSTEVAA